MKKIIHLRERNIRRTLKFVRKLRNQNVYVKI